MKTMLLGFGLALTAPAFAQGDSSADAAGFAQAVAGSDAVIIRVPLDAQGRELSSAAELRVSSGADMSTSSDLQAAFDAGVDASSQPQLDIDADSSTSWSNSCNYGWNRYSYGSGWNSSYNYYSSYTPTYYYGYNTSYYNSYSYSYSSYRDYYRPSGNYYGYRYYYYDRCW
jgi:hypothetical protein